MAGRGIFGVGGQRPIFDELEPRMHLDAVLAQGALIDRPGVNDLPVAYACAPQQTPDGTALVFSTAGGNAISVDDPDVGGATLQVHLRVEHGRLTLPDIAGLHFETGDGVGDRLLGIIATRARLNEVLDGLTYTPDADFLGQDTLVISVDDRGNIGTGGAMVNMAAVDIMVYNLNSAPEPVAGQYATPLNTAVSGQALALDGDGDALTYQMTGEPLHGTIDFRDDGTFTYTPNPDYLGKDNILFTAWDGQEFSATGMIEFTVGTALVKDFERVYTYTDADGDQVTVKLIGPGMGKVLFAHAGPCDASRIVLTGVSDRTRLSVTVKGPNGATDVWGIEAPDGALRSISARKVNLRGDVTIGPADNSRTTLALTLGCIQDASIHSQVRVNSFVAKQWTNTDRVRDVLAAPSVKNLNIRGDARQGLAGDFGADLDLWGNGIRDMTLRLARIAGSMTGCQWNLIGSLGDIVVRGAVQDSQVFTSKRMGTLRMGAAYGSDFMAGIYDHQAPSARGDFDPEGKIHAVKVVGLPGQRGVGAPRFVVGSNFAASRIGRVLLTNADAGAQAGLYAMEYYHRPAMYAIRHVDTCDDANNWCYPSRQQDVHGAPGASVNIF